MSIWVNRPPFIYREKNLSGHHIKQLENDGYCRLPQLITASEIEESLSLDREWFVRSENSSSDNVPFLNRHHPMV